VSYGDTNLRALINISVAARIELPSINPTPGHPLFERYEIVFTAFATWRVEISHTRGVASKILK